MTRTLHLERPAFWTETSDPEAWFRALEVLASRPPEQGSPRSVADRTLVGVISRRGAAGLFGLVDQLLPGVGQIHRNLLPRAAAERVDDAQSAADSGGCALVAISAPLRKGVEHDVVGQGQQFGHIAVGIGGSKGMDFAAEFFAAQAGFMRRGSADAMQSLAQQRIY